MIAIAGAKGGCGKTTLTVGLARAFARAGEPTIAVDTDRQLPNLHVVTDAERTPTLSDAVDDVGSAVQPLSETPDAGVISAPEPADSIDVSAALSRLRGEDVRILLDCPSGAGPDVTDPLEAADRVVVATTNTERGRRASRTTIEMARRLGIPVAGAVVMRSAGATTDLESALGVPVLGAVPECESPLSADGTRDAFDAIAGRLYGDPSSGESRPGVDADRLSTGIRSLDAALGGGFPPGSVVALTADPASQSEHLLADVTRTRGTLYLATDRSRRNVERALDSTGDQGVSPTVRRVSGENRLERATALVEKLPEGANLVVDSTNALERTDRDAYLEFLNAVIDRIADIEGFAVLHCLKGRPVPDHRPVTKQLVDGVVDLRTYSAGVGTGVEHTLSVPKRRARRFTETIDLDLGRSWTRVAAERRDAH
ncbi:DUF7125 family protein [Natrarchaeobius chitinivorans]|uniref:CobQ/CobB/MinD/ParA nucleotide binding domain-containing protein n=1 Tax=Natrarchaeobius chitinivorans TaxID=1679083 RepID=A0A3N6LZL5_NATCH|nr:AAA family ATPase [Natrarchaeobius chitinivorans]RQG94657.1 hypothetical protein EA473_11290 [Natrarchaeobius chitinivorans]